MSATLAASRPWELTISSPIKTYGAGRRCLCGRKLAQDNPGPCSSCTIEAVRREEELADALKDVTRAMDRVIIVLSTRWGLSPHELAEACSVTDNSIRDVLARLETEGLVYNFKSQGGGAAPNVWFRTDSGLPPGFALKVLSLLDTERHVEELVASTGYGETVLKWQIRELVKQGLVRRKRGGFFVNVFAPRRG